MIGGIAGGVATEIFSDCVRPPSETIGGGIWVHDGLVFGYLCGIVELPVFMFYVVWLSLGVLLALWVLVWLVKLITRSIPDRSVSKENWAFGPRFVFGNQCVNPSRQCNCSVLWRLGRFCIGVGFRLNRKLVGLATPCF